MAAFLAILLSLFGPAHHHVAPSPHAPVVHPFDGTPGMPGD